MQGDPEVIEFLNEQLTGQLLIEELEDLGVALHRRGSFHTGDSGECRRMISPVPKIVQ